MTNARTTTPPAMIPAIIATFVVSESDGCAETLGSKDESVDLLAGAARGGGGEKIWGGGVCEPLALGGGGERTGAGGETVFEGGGGAFSGGGGEGGGGDKVALRGGAEGESLGGGA